MNALLAAQGIDPWIAFFSLVTVVITVGMGFWTAGKSKSAGDFFVAGRSVSVGWNASAISGEYLSAASFMGVAGMVMATGYDALWYPVCYACRLPLPPALHRRPAASLRRLHHPRLRRRPLRLAAVPQDRRLLRPLHRLLLHHAADEGRRHHARLHLPRPCPTGPAWSSWARSSRSTSRSAA
jgi:hypothetical protein